MQKIKTLISVTVAFMIFTSVSGEEISTLAKRRNVRNELQTSSNKAQIAQNYLSDSDAVIRQMAVTVLFAETGEKAVIDFEKMSEDKDFLVRKRIVDCLAALDKKSDAVLKVLKKIERSDPDEKLRALAADASWPFYREVKLIRRNPTTDREIKTFSSIDLSEFKWKFTTDKENCGHERKYFVPAFDDSTWNNIKLTYWNTQGFPDYHGVAWYRVEFDMPAQISCDAVEINFAGVDESAWVWLNGIYLGAHDIGPGGWNVPFQLDASKEILWKKKNVLVVRVLDTQESGGIWKTVKVDLLK